MSLYDDLPPTKDGTQAPVSFPASTSRPGLSGPALNNQWNSLASLMPQKMVARQRARQPGTEFTPKKGQPKPVVPNTLCSEPIEAAEKNTNLSMSDEDEDEEVVEIVHEYDPAQPNDYEYVCQLRRQNHERSIKEKRQKEEFDRSREAGPVQVTMGSGEDAYQRRLKMSMQAETKAQAPVREAALLRNHEAPAWSIRMPNAPSTQDECERSPTPPPSSPTSLVSAPPAPIDQPSSPPIIQPSVPVVKQSIAQRLMAKMGWKKGQGLGASEQGITQPLVARKSGAGHMVIKEAATRKAKKRRIEDGQRLIMLTNMVGRGEVDEDVEHETSDECAKFGLVEKCVVFERDETSIPDEESVRIFVLFSHAESARKALSALHDRLFGGRRVCAVFYDAQTFANGNYIA